MLQIQDTIVSLDVIETFFCCDLEKCKGQCCVEGDAGAPLDRKEALEIEKALPAVDDLVSPQARSVIERQGVSYIDSEGDLVTSIINGKDCVFTCYSDGICLCALEKAAREGKIKNVKPASCSLYPVRLTEYPTFTAVNFHKWDVCKPAMEKGLRERIRVYEFLKEPLIKRFGREWWEELALTASVYLEEKSKGK